MARTFKVRGWEKHQHYKDRNPPWIRFYNSTLDDYDIAHLPDVAKAHLFGIWLLASKHDNCIPYDPEWVARRINATSVVDLEQLAIAELIEVDGIRTKTLARRKQLDVPEERRGETEESRTPIAPRGASFSQDFLDFWKAYPEKVGKNAAWKAWKKSSDRPELQIVLAALERYKKSKPDDRPWCNPATWINQGRYADEPQAVEANKPTETVSEIDLWRSRVQVWSESPKPPDQRFWHGGWGLPPHKNNPQIPTALVIEFNLDGLTPPAFCRRTA